MKVVGWWKAQAQTEAARELLKREVDSNLSELSLFWEKVRPRKGEDEIHRVDKIIYARELAEAELPQFSRKAFAEEQSAKALSPCVSREQLAQLEQFYARLDRIQDIRQQLRETRARDIAAHAVPEESQSPAYEEFNRAAPWLWMEASQLIQEILAQGNPLWMNHRY